MVKFIAWDRLEKGRISSVYFNLNEVGIAKVSMYGTDGYQTRSLGKQLQQDLGLLGDILLGQEIGVLKELIE